MVDVSRCIATSIAAGMFGKIARDGIRFDGRICENCQELDAMDAAKDARAISGHEKILQPSDSNGRLYGHQKTKSR